MRQVWNRSLASTKSSRKSTMQTSSKDSRKRLVWQWTKNRKSWISWGRFVMSIFNASKDSKRGLRSAKLRTSGLTSLQRKKKTCQCLISIAKLTLKSSTLWRPSAKMPKLWSKSLSPNSRKKMAANYPTMPTLGRSRWNLPTSTT